MQREYSALKTLRLEVQDMRRKIIEKEKPSGLDNLEIPPYLRKSTA